MFLCDILELKGGEENEKIHEEPKSILPKVMRETIKKEEEEIKFEELKPVEKSGIKENDYTDLRRIIHEKQKNRN